MSKKSRVKPCPFCGAIPIIDKAAPGLWNVVCDGASMHMAVSTAGDRHNAIKAWNRRRKTK